MNPSKRTMPKTLNDQGVFQSSHVCAAVGFLTLLLSLLSPAQLAAQGCLNALGQNDPAIAWANCINNQMPQAVPQQTIMLGALQWSPDGSRVRMVWTMTDMATGAANGLPGSCPGFGASGGLVSLNPPVCPTLNSYDMRYQVLIAKPDFIDLHNLRVVLTNPTVGGGSEDVTATLEQSSSPSGLGPGQNLFGGTLATIPFHPHLLAEQTLNFYYAGQPIGCTFAGDVINPCTFYIKPSLQPQLGAFVVPYVPLAVIYQPPKGCGPCPVNTNISCGSYASYEVGSTVGTTLSWSTSTTEGTIQTKNSSDYLDAASAAFGAASNIPGPTQAPFKLMSGILGAVHGIWNTKTVETQSTNQGQTESNGWSVGFKQTLSTLPCTTEDVFVYLKNVLFVYTVVPRDPVSRNITPDGVLTVATVAVRYDAPLNPLPFSQLQKELQPSASCSPSCVASALAQFRALDLQMNPKLLSLALQQTQQPITKTSGLGEIPVKGLLIGRNRLQDTGRLLCSSRVDVGYGEETMYFNANDRSQATTTTTTTNVTGFLASILGQAGETTQSLTYSSNVSYWTQVEKGSKLDLFCPEYLPNDGLVMEVYLDTLTGTLLAVPGAVESASGQPQPMIAGHAYDPQGHPVSNQQVLLRIAGKTYGVPSDAGGNFAFRFAGIPKGSGSLIVGNQGFPISYNGTPLNKNLRIASGVAATSGLGKAIGGANLGNVLKPVTPCCPITSIDAAARIVTAKVTGTAQSFQFAAKDPALLKSLRIGQGVFANFKTRQVSLDGRTACCEIVSGASGQSASIAPVPGAVPTFGPKPMSSAGTASSGKGKGKAKGKQTAQAQGANSLGGDTSQLSANEGDTATAIRGAAPPHPSGQNTPPCCRITAISRANGVVTAKEETTGRQFQFRVTDARLLQSLAVAQGVYANFRTQQVSLDGRTACCSIVAPPAPPLR